MKITGTLLPFFAAVCFGQQTTWTSIGSPVQVSITGGPMATYLGSTHVNLIFDGYDAAYVGGSDYSSYRTVGHVTLEIGNNVLQ